MVKQYIYATSSEEALDYLKNTGGVIVAGGTTVALTSKPDTLIDITRANLNYIKMKDNSLVIGATTTLGDIIKSPLCYQYLGEGFVQGVKQIGSRQLQNMATIGGNIAIPYHWRDLPVLLLVLEAKVKLETTNGENLLPIEALTADGYCTFLKDKLITEIIIPVEEKVNIEWEKFTITASDVSILSVATNITLNENKWKRVKIAVGSLTKNPFRLKALEEELLNKEKSIELIDKALEKIHWEEIKVFPDQRVSKDYKLNITKVLLKRILTKGLRAR